MLIFGRLVNQSIKIGDNIEVMVVEINGKIVRLGITAPKEVPVHRHEIQERIKATKEAANDSQS